MKTMSEMKTTLDGNNDRLDIVEEKTLKVEKGNKAKLLTQNSIPNENNFQKTR